MTTEGTLRDPKPSATEERVDGLLQRVSARRRETIIRSMERPFRMEVLRTGFIVGCVLLDLVLLPIALTELLGRPGFLISILLLMPLAYFEYRIHTAWFVKNWMAVSK